MFRYTTKPPIHLNVKSEQRYLKRLGGE